MKTIKQYYRLFRRHIRRGNMRKNHDRFLKDIPVMVNTETLSELDFAAGYFTGAIKTAAEFGEITIGQEEELIKIVGYIHEGERGKREEA